MKVCTRQSRPSGTLLECRHRIGHWWTPRSFSHPCPPLADPQDFCHYLSLTAVYSSSSSPGSRLD
jgi:hypothetical protein